MSIRYARTLIKEALELGAPVLLERRKYWKLAVFELFLEHCDAYTFSQPTFGLFLAELAPDFARCVARNDRSVVEESLLLRAHAVLGSAYRAVGRLEEAEDAYRMAGNFEVPRLERAELLRRLAYLRMEQRRLEDAMACIDEAIFLHRTEGDLRDCHFLGCCLLARGHVQFEIGARGQALIDISACLNYIDLQRDPRRYYAAVHNLAVALVEAGSPNELASALDQLKTAYRRLIGKKGKNLAKYKLRWLQGLIQVKFGAERQAEQYFHSARDGFVQLAAPYEAAMVSLDLAVRYLYDRRFFELKRLLAETYSVFRALEVDRESLAALALIQTAFAEECLTLEQITRTRAMLGARATAAM